MRRRPNSTGTLAATAITGFCTPQAKAGTEDERQEAETALAEAVSETPQIPALPRLTVDDVTPERLASLMAENDGCIALMSSEGGVFGMMAGRYNDKGGPNLDVYLKGHSGDSLRVDRADGRTLHVPRTALTMGLTVQPAVIRELGKTPGFRHRGLPARGLYAVPRSLMGTRMSQDRLIDASKKAAYAWAIRRVLSVAAAAPEEGTYGRHRLRIAGDALAVFRPEADRVERALGPHECLIVYPLPSCRFRDRSAGDGCVPRCARVPFKLPCPIFDIVGGDRGRNRRAPKPRRRLPRAGRGSTMTATMTARWATNRDTWRCPKWLNPGRMKAGEGGR